MHTEKQKEVRWYKFHVECYGKDQKGEDLTKLRQIANRVAMKYKTKMNTTIRIRKYMRKNTKMVGNCI